MFVQSHIQRHHHHNNNHHHHHHHHSHNNHQPQQHQLHGHNHKANPDATSVASIVASRKSTGCNVTRGAAAVSSDNQTKSATARLAYNSTESSKQVFISGDCSSEQKPPELATQVKSSADAVNSNSNSFKLHYQNDDHRVRVVHENRKTDCHSSRETKTREQDKCEGSRGFVDIRSFDQVNSSAVGLNRRQRLSNETEFSLSLLNRTEHRKPHRNLPSGRDRTRSLGSHRSLEVYDFMTRNKQGAAHGSTAATTCSSKSSLTNGSYCGDHLAGDQFNSQSRQFSTTLRLAKSVSVDETKVVSSVDQIGAGAGTGKFSSPRRAFSESGCRNSTRGAALQRYIKAGSQQLLALILDTQTWFLLAGRLSSTLFQPRQINQSSPDTINSSSSGGRSGNSSDRSKSIELVQNFCLSFISYQVETWRLLANDLAIENKQRAHPRAGLGVRSMDTELHCQASQDHHYARDGSAATAAAAAPKRAKHAQQEIILRSAAAVVATSARSQVDDYAHQLGARKFHSLDRPVLARQREVVFDEDENSGLDAAEPLIRIPAIIRAPAPPMQPPAVAPRHRHSHQLHHHQHNHNYHTDQQSQMVASHDRTVVSQIQLESFDVLMSGNGTHHSASQQQQQCGLFAHQYRDPPIEKHENHPTECTANFAALSTVNHNSENRAKFYLGQHSLDCGNMQTRPTPYGVVPARQLFLPEEHSIEQNVEECFVGQVSAKQDGFWSSDDRPLSDDDFQRPAMKGHLQTTIGASTVSETDDRSTNGNCDQYSLRKNTTILVAEGCRQLSRKKRSIKKSSSPLSFDGARRRLGLKRKTESNQLSSISVNRSEEVIPTEVSHLSRQTTFNSLYDSGTESGHFWQGQTQCSPDPRSHFVEGIGFGQIASRQALVSPHLGDIQLSLSSRRGMLEVEVIRARGLHAKAGAKSSPSPYVKVYLMKEKKCIAKCRTHQVKQTLDPLFQEPFVFRNEFKNCVLQVIVWGDYGKRDRKSMMGIVQIRLDELDISNMVIGWYKLFNIPSMTNSLASSKNLRQKLLHSASITESPINCS